MVSTCGESLPPPWLSSFQTVDPLAHFFATCLLPSPNPAVWCHPRPPLQPRPSPLAILTPATARVGAPWLLLRAETRIEGSARIGRLSYLHTRIHIYIHRFKCCPSGYRWSWLWKRPLACSGVGTAIVRWEIPLWPGENGPSPIPMPDPSHEHARAPWIDRARSRLLAAYPPPGADGFSTMLDLFYGGCRLPVYVPFRSTFPFRFLIRRLRDDDSRNDVRNLCSTVKKVNCHRGFVARWWCFSPLPSSVDGDFVDHLN